MARLKGKTCLVTGAGRGIGAAIAAAFVDEGAQVWVTDLDGAGAAAVAAELGEAARAATLDVREEAAWDTVLGELLAEAGHLDVLVNNAGITGFEGGAVAHDPEHASLADRRGEEAQHLFARTE